MQICILVSVVMLSVVMLSVVMLSVVMLSVVMLSVIMPSVEILNVVVPISLIIVCVNEKVWQFVMALKSIDNKKIYLFKKNVFLNAAQRLNQ